MAASADWNPVMWLKFSAWSLDRNVLLEQNCINKDFWILLKCLKNKTVLIVSRETINCVCPGSTCKRSSFPTSNLVKDSCVTSFLLPMQSKEWNSYGVLRSYERMWVGSRA